MPNGNLHQTLSNLSLNCSNSVFLEFYQKSRSKISLILDESFNNSFIFDFQPEFSGALSSRKHLVSGDVLLFYISNKVMFNPTLI